MNKKINEFFYKRFLSLSNSNIYHLHIHSIVQIYFIKSIKHFGIIKNEIFYYLCKIVFLI